MLAAPLRLVLLQWPNCSAILSFLRLAVKACCRRMLCYTRLLMFQQHVKEGRGHVRNKKWYAASRHFGGLPVELGGQLH